MSSPWPPPGQPAAAPFTPGGIAGRGGPRQPPNKLLLGCGVALVAGLLLTVVLWLVGAYFLYSSGDQLPTAAVIGEGSTGALHFRDDPDDPGLTAFLDLLGAELKEFDRRRKGKDLPEDLRWLQELQGGQQLDADALRMYLPTDATVALEGRGPGEGELLFAANPAGFVRVIKTVLTRIIPAKPGAERKYRGAELLGFGDGQWLGFHGGTVLFAAELPALKLGVDRLEAEVAGVPPSPLRAELQPIAERWHLSGLVRLPARELLALLDRLATGLEVPAEDQLAQAGDRSEELAEPVGEAERRFPPPPSLPAAVAEQEAAASFGLSVAGADHFRAELRFDAQGAVADAVRERFERLLALGTALAEQEGLVVTVHEAHAERAYRVELTGVEEAVKRWAAELPVR